MIFIVYALVAACVVWLSVKASNYVDLLDKKTSLSGAFIGGIMLSAVTSLPELFTSISATILIHEPGLCLGNILGSDLFNLAALSACILIFARSFRNAYVSQSHNAVVLLVLGCYAVIILNWLGILDFTFLSLSITSVFLVILYICSVKFLAAEDSSPDDSSAADQNPLTVRQIVIRFIFVSIGIVLVSIILTYATDIMAERLHLGQGLAGALFLGVATSLPELSSTFTLFRIKNFDIAFGNIVGSCIFNFIIMAVVDILYVSGSVYDFSDPQTITLMICGAAALPFTWLLIKSRNWFSRFVCPAAVIVCYIIFLLG